ncbi:odorant receptor 2a-like [Melanaphis sacchari]|uniref:odorant receptor 2a-like n=1 Tax=Melanaphis sacchari TaxID=742174 RepID=UPI000DC13BB8|nr:odorant receptor 2a-like [Melanaphis sacchari]
MILPDILIISWCWGIIAQQEVLSQSFRNIGLEDNSQKIYYEEFKSILADQIRLNLKIKSFYSVVRPIILTYVAIKSTCFIIVTYVLLAVCLSEESHSILEIIKLGSSALYLCVHLFLYCYLFDNMNVKLQSVNTSIYSCDWTKMDVKFKKLLLLTMQMNNANNLMIKASPKKIVNLQLFANIVTMSYNIVSVMLKITG